MRMRTSVGMLVGALAIVVLARPAAAQGTRIDLSGGYQYFSFIDDYTGQVPAGWEFSIAAGKERVKFVADFGGHYKQPTTYTVWFGDTPYQFTGSSEKLHTVKAGVEFSGRDRRVVPFGRLLTGVGL